MSDPSEVDVSEVLMIGRFGFRYDAELDAVIMFFTGQENWVDGETPIPSFKAVAIRRQSVPKFITALTQLEY